MAKNLLFNDTIILVEEKYKDKDKYGNNIVDTVETELFCNVMGVKRQEFYNAGISGYKASFNVLINDFEFNYQEKAIYQDTLFEIIKTYPLENGILELTLGERVRNNK